MPGEKEELEVGGNQECVQGSRSEEKSVSGRRAHCSHQMLLNAGADGNREEAAGFGVMEFDGELGTGRLKGTLA